MSTVKHALCPDFSWGVRHPSPHLPAPSLQVLLHSLAQHHFFREASLHFPAPGPISLLYAIQLLSCLQGNCQFSITHAEAGSCDSHPSPPARLLLHSRDHVCHPQGMLAWRLTHRGHLVSTSQWMSRGHNLAGSPPCNQDCWEDERAQTSEEAGTARGPEKHSVGSASCWDR